MGKYDKYICTTLQKRHMLPGPTPEERDKIAAEGYRLGMEHVLWIDDEVIPGAYYGESTWLWPSSYPNVMPFAEAMKRITNPTPMFPHAHDFPELLSWWGTDPDNPDDTTTMGMLMADEEIRVDRSWIAYVPAGMLHMPTQIAGKVTSRPVCHWTSGPGGVYTREKDKRPDYMCETDPKYTRPIAVVDEVVIPGAEFGCETMWLLPGEKSKAGQLMMKAHTQPHGTSIVFSALNFKDVTDLCAEVELWIGGEKHTINRSFGAYIPPDVEQGPVIIRNITQQIFFMISYPIGEGIKKYSGR